MWLPRKPHHPVGDDPAHAIDAVHALVRQRRNKSPVSRKKRPTSAKPNSHGIGVRRSAPQVTETPHSAAGDPMGPSSGSARPPGRDATSPSKPFPCDDGHRVHGAVPPRVERPAASIQRRWGILGILTPGVQGVQPPARDRLSLSADRAPSSSARSATACRRHHLSAVVPCGDARSRSPCASGRSRRPSGQPSWCA